MDPPVKRSCRDVYKCTYSQKYVRNSKINTRGTFVIIHGNAQSGKKSESPDAHFPADAEQGKALPSPFGSHTVNQSPFHCLSAT